MEGKLPLSAAIITKDEEKNLRGCLDTLSLADEIIVVDSGSRDKTVDIARGFGCRVFVEEWKGFGPQKNSALEKCRHDWVLVIDADERVPAESWEAIAAILRAPPRADAYSFRRKNFLHGRWLKHSGYWPDRQIRLVNRTRGSFRAEIHERWVTDGPIQRLDAFIEHFSFTDYSDMFKRLDSYSTIGARASFASGKRAGPLTPVFHGIGMFIKIYLLKRGFLDGMDGLVTALTKAGGAFLKYAKLLELQNEDKK